jgi:predicted nuclease of restriction endonuclease-like (RecB) superfamily
MVIAYWLIGREIFNELQKGEKRASYGKKIVASLSSKLTRHFGKGYSETTLQYCRKFYLSYPLSDNHNSRPPGVKYNNDELTNTISRPLGVESLPDFSPQLTWSHYRVLMRIESLEARNFYEREAIEGSWDKRTLERQIHTHYYQRCLKSQNTDKMISDGRCLPSIKQSSADILKNPYVLEFLGLPDFVELHEIDLEQAIISHLQRFLLELGNGFAFVARQKHIRIDDDDRYIDLVFYHCRLKFYLLIDLKLEKLTHGDVGQMDGYVRMFDGLYTAPDDNPTIGLILCTEKSDTVARYSVLNDRKQIFASKYMLCLPTENELQREIEKERRLIENMIRENKDAR